MSPADELGLDGERIVSLKKARKFRICGRVGARVRQAEAEGFMGESYRNGE